MIRIWKIFFPWKNMVKSCKSPFICQTDHFLVERKKYLGTVPSNFCDDIFVLESFMRCCVWLCWPSSLLSLSYELNESAITLLAVWELSLTSGDLVRVQYHFFLANACSVASTIISSTSIVRLSEAMAKPGQGGCGCPTSARRNRQGQFLVQTAKHRMFYMGTRTCHSGWFPMKWRDTAWLININESWSGHAMEDNYLPLLVSAQAKSMSHA